MKHKQQPKKQERHGQSPQPHPQRQNGSSKQHVLVDLLTRTEGATIAQIVGRHQLAGAQRARCHQRRAQEKAGAAYCLGEVKRWGAHLPRGRR